MTDREQLDENIQAMAAPFGEEDEKILRAHLDRIRPLVCRMCGSCDGACPKGLPTSELVRCATYADGYRSLAMGRARFARLPAELRQVRCADCVTCPLACPNGVQIRAQVTRAQELFG
jgi:predicted aldo/keto reductase-like oxidoreductase